MIPLFRPRIAPDAARRVADVLASGYVGEGKVTAEFEVQLAALLGVPEVMAVDSCTSAITLALHLIGVGPGDEVISTPMTCAATNGAIVRAGARIVWADVEPATGCVDYMDVKRRVTERTRAVVCVDWGGRSCNYAALRSPTGAYAGHWPQPLIEDAAHSLLALHRDRPIAHWGGDYVCWSFGPIKHLTCGGHGGGLLAPPEQMDRARLLRWHGLDRRSNEDFRAGQRIREAGYKMHLTDVDAAIGLANLPLAALTVAQHRANARWLDDALRGVPGIVTPPPDPGCSYWLYCILTPERDRFIAWMAERGIQTSPVHRRNDRHPAFGRLCEPGELPGVDYFDSHVAAVPVGWWLSPGDLEQIAGAVTEWGMQRSHD